MRGLTAAQIKKEDEREAQRQARYPIAYALFSTLQELEEALEAGRAKWLGSDLTTVRAEIAEVAAFIGGLRAFPGAPVPDYSEEQARGILVRVGLVSAAA